MTKLGLYFTFTMTTLATGCVDSEPAMPDDGAFVGDDSKADGVEPSYFSVTKHCVDTTCTLTAEKLNSTEITTIKRVYWPATHSTEDLARIEDSLFGARVIVRGAIRNVNAFGGGTYQALEGVETWLAATGGFVFGKATFASLQPVKTFCPQASCPKTYSQGVLNGPRLDDVEVDLSTLQLLPEDRVAIEAQLDGNGLLAIGEEQVDATGVNFVVKRAYLPIP